MDSFYSMLNQVNSEVESYVDCMEDVIPDVLGLDRRCGRKIHVTEERIAVSKEDDRNLQYYGGFEYIDSEYRTEIGGYVFYSEEDERVREHIHRWLDSKSE